MFAHSKGRMAEWLGSGLQNHLHRFESGSDLFLFFIVNKKYHPNSYQQVFNNFVCDYIFFYLNLVVVKYAPFCIFFSIFSTLTDLEK